MLDSTKKFLNTLNESETMKARLTEARRNAEINNKVAPRKVEGSRTSIDTRYSVGDKAEKNIPNSRKLGKIDGSRDVFSTEDYEQYKYGTTPDFKDYNKAKDEEKSALGRAEMAKTSARQAEKDARFYRQNAKDLSASAQKHKEDKEKAKAKILAKKTNESEELNEVSSNELDYVAFQSKVDECGGLYGFVANNYYNMGLELLKEIALNAIYELDNDDLVIADLKERVFNLDVGGI